MYRDQEQRDFARQLRNQPTLAEQRLWHFLRARKLKVKFRRQFAIGSYIVDFVCISHRLVVELDGPQHLDPTAIDHDARRTLYLTLRGFRVLRFRNQELDENMWAVVEAIERAVDRAANVIAQPHPNPPPRRGREPNRVRFERCDCCDTRRLTASLATRFLPWHTARTDSATLGRRGD